MAFERRNNLARKRRNRRGGRPTKAQAEQKRLSAELTRKHLEDRLRPVLDTYFSLATGDKAGNKRRKIDPATCRHYVERFIGPAPRSLIVDMQETIESFFEKVQAMDEGQGEDEGKERADG